MSLFVFSSKKKKGNPAVVFYFFNYYFCNATVLAGEEKAVKVKSKGSSPLFGYPFFLPFTCRRLFLAVDLNAVQSAAWVCACVVGVCGGFDGRSSRAALEVGAAFPPGLGARGATQPARP